MRAILKVLGWLLMALAGAGVLLWVFGPLEPVDTAKRFDASAIGDDPDAYLANAEARFDDITPGAQKSIHWAGAPGDKTDWVLVYVHGFSATALEAAPLPAVVGQGLQANVLNMRLAGHGRGGAAMAGPAVADWMTDLDEALAIADQIGDRTIVLGVSTGATLAGLGLLSGRADQIDAVVMMSPNFQIKNPLSFVLTLPGFRHWGPPLFGETRSWEPHNALHAEGWTTSYPTVATLPMAAMVRAANAGDYSDVQAPLLLFYAPDDQVIEPKAALKIAQDWGGPVTESEQILTELDDPSRHVLAGRALSPNRTEGIARDIVDWAKGL